MNAMFSRFYSSGLLNMCSALSSARDITSLQYCKAFLPSLPTCYFFVVSSYSDNCSHDIQMVAFLNFNTYREKNVSYCHINLLCQITAELWSVQNSQRHH